MKQKFLLFFLLIFGWTSSFAQGFPTVSTADNTVWYLIQFMNGGKAFTASTSGSEISVAAATGGDDQLWKVTGNETSGYSFTNKKGYTLYVNSATLNQKVFAASNASTGVNTFKINATGYSDYSGSYSLQATQAYR